MRLSAIALVYLPVFWPVWQWLWQRLFDKSDEPLGFLALVSFVVLWSARGRKGQSSASDVQAAPTQAMILLMAAYGLSTLIAPRAVQTLLCLITVGLTINSMSRSKLLAGDWMLLTLSVPIVSTLNFYLGYPLRVAAAAIAAPLLNIASVPASVQGTSIFWKGQYVEVDAPCSGIKMLWMAEFLAAAFSSYFSLSARQTVLMSILAAAAAVIANVLRVTSLFYVESEIVKVPSSLHEFVHQGIGVVSFAVLGAIILMVSLKLAPKLVSDGVNSDVRVARDRPLPDTRKAISLFSAACIFAFSSPFIGRFISQPAFGDVAGFSGWPGMFEGMPLEEIETRRQDEIFARDFPGELQAFRNGDRIVLMRWVKSVTRQLHSSADCYRGLGYEIDWLPRTTDEFGKSWSTYTATKGGEKLRIRERIFDEKGNSWTDVSAWYWAAMAGRSLPPYWTTTVIRQEQ